ncbi:MAG: hypothetical protein EAZ07_03635 [Cytophagales bacterium]|nr:MAG: hypothetical protein EAZ07_03635 [Cytophagales bacterium]
MKKLILLGIVLATSLMTAYAQQFMQITTIESVVPGGLGRSRMISSTPTGSVDEIKLENFFSLVGINFENIRYNDKLITDKIADMYKQGWKLINVTPGVYGADKSTGIFITRYLFQKD